MPEEADDVLLVARGLAKRYTRDLRSAQRYAALDILGEVTPGSRQRLRRNEFWALRDIDLTVRRGQAVGVIGHNGAGKSTLLRMLHGLVLPDAGHIEIRGQHAALLDLGAPFSRILTARENVVAAATVHGVPAQDIDALVDQVAEFSDLGDRMDTPLATHSTGMQMRLGYAIAAQLRPDLLLIDEVIAVGDLAFQRRCLEHIRRHLADGGGLVLVSHDMWMIQAVCDRVLVLADGRIVEDTTPSKAISHYLRDLRVARVPPMVAGEGGDAGTDDAGEVVDLAVDAMIAAAPDGGSIVRGGTVEVVVRVRSLAGRRTVRWGLDLLASDMQVCIATLRPPDDEPVVVAQETAELRCTIPDVPLFPGLFHLDAVFEDDVTGEPIAVSGGGATFEVASLSTRLDTLAQISAVVSSIEGTFSISSDPIRRGADQVAAIDRNEVRPVADGARGSDSTSNQEGGSS